MKKLLQHIQDNLIFQFKSDKDLVKEIQILNKNFTVERDHLIQNYQSKAQIAAYTYFYGLSNLTKIFAFDSILNFRQIFNQDLFIYDFGCGPGVYSLGIKEILGDHFQGSLLIDQSELMLKQAQRICQGEEFSFSQKVHRQSGSQTSLFIYGNSLNEIDPEVYKLNQQRISPDYYLLIEPGTPESFQKFTLFRDYLLAQNYQVLYPCLHQQACPLQGNDKNWCHQYVSVNLEQEISTDYAKICQKVGRKRNHMPVLFSILMKDKNANKMEDEKKGTAFIVRNYKKNKAFHFFDLCFADESKVEKVQLPRRQFSKDENNRIAEICSGDRVVLSYKENKLINVIKE